MTMHKTASLHSMVVYVDANRHSYNAMVVSVLGTMPNNLVSTSSPVDVMYDGPGGVMTARANSVVHASTNVARLNCWCWPDECEQYGITIPGQEQARAEAVQKRATEANKQRNESQRENRMQAPASDQRELDRNPGSAQAQAEKGASYDKEMKAKEVKDQKSQDTTGSAAPRERSDRKDDEKFKESGQASEEKSEATPQAAGSASSPVASATPDSGTAPMQQPPAIPKKD